MGKVEIQSGIDIIERHLDNWARWQKSHDLRLGYPTRAMVARGGGQSVSGVFEEICDSLDRHAAEVMECLVHDLDLAQRGAIYHCWLGCTIRVRNYEQCLSDAYNCLLDGIVKRGLT